MRKDPEGSPTIRRSPGLAPDGTVETGNLSVPFSRFASVEAWETLFTGLDPAPSEIANDVTALRKHYATFNDRLRDRMLERFEVEITAIEVADIPVHKVTPASPNTGRNRVLLNLHGGAFMWGSGSGALVEAIPIAASTGIPVIAVDYRLAPEHTFPAASNDVQAVYQALLASVPAKSIGVYGCSAGAILTAQCMVQFRERNLPLPGGIALLGGAGLLPFGDSAYTSSALCGEHLDEEPDDGNGVMNLIQAYLGDTPLDDPKVVPGESAQILGQFPPTLLIAGSRDFSASSVTTMHRRLVAQKVPAELFIFDGLWHAFHIFPDLPESIEVYGLLADFFERKLSAGDPEPVL